MTIEWKGTPQGDVLHAEVVSGIAYCGTTGLVEAKARHIRKCARCSVSLAVERG